MTTLANFLKTAHNGDHTTIRNNRTIETYTLTADPETSTNEITTAPVSIFAATHNKDARSYDAIFTPTGTCTLSLDHRSGQVIKGLTPSSAPEHRKVYIGPLKTPRFNEKKFLEYWEAAWAKNFPCEELPLIR